MSLAEHIDAAFAPPEADDEEGRQRFVIDGPKTAEWALRKLGRLRGRMAANDDLANEERRRIDEWLANENAKLQRDASFFEGLLREWQEAVLETEDRKTISLPAGTLRARRLPDRWTFDGDAFLAWAVRAGRDDLIRTPAPEVDRPKVKQSLVVEHGIVVDPATGETVDGVTVEPGDVRYSVEVTP